MSGLAGIDETISGIYPVFLFFALIYWVSAGPIFAIEVEPSSEQSDEAFNKWDDKKWDDKYGDQFDNWFAEMAFNTNIFYCDLCENLNTTSPTPNLVDVVYDVAIRGPD